MKKFITKTIIILGLILTISGFVWAEEALIVAEGKLNSKIGSELFTLLLEIKSIELRGDVFSDPAFSKLKDFGVELQDQPTGRDNPFLKI
ncbi:MAG: hypothetical protein PHX25_03530 [Candidatus Pacebacteria bacterium]|nr:hypothetical protein [Candidatus Paceibacterota bacterium]